MDWNDPLNPTPTTLYVWLGLVFFTAIFSAGHLHFLGVLMLPIAPAILIAQYIIEKRTLQFRLGELPEQIDARKKAQRTNDEK